MRMTALRDGILSDPFDGRPEGDLCSYFEHGVDDCKEAEEDYPPFIVIRHC